jgi:hypothetical protein
VRRGAIIAAAVVVLLVAAAPAEGARPGCDPIDPAHCLLPWPNDHFRKGGRLALRDAMMPRNRQGEPIRAADYNRSDGFSPGQTIVTRVPGLDLRRSGAVPVNDLARAFVERAPIVVIDARSGRRQLIWAELDSQAMSPRLVDGATQLTPDVKRVDGTFTVPCFLDQPGCPRGSRFKLGRRRLIERIPGNVQVERFICLVPNAVQNARPLIFGHGLLGGAEAVLGLAPLAVADEFVACATDWSGMSAEDIPNVLELSRDLSKFPTLADRNQQGFLNFMFLGRLMIHARGFDAHPQFGGRIDTRRLFYAGASQGGILGGALTAVAPDFQRSALIVPGMNFSLLLARSSQFGRFADALYPSYPDQIERALINSMIQILWDGGEANGYAWHMTRDPYPETPRHTVLLHEAFGDHQVANVATRSRRA